VDWKIRLGLLKSRMPYEFPIIPGWDAAGVVSAIGKEVKSFKVGDEVFAYCRQDKIKLGTYADYICIPAENAADKPHNISFAQAAAIPLAGLTAWQSLFDAAHLENGQTVLIQAGAGGVGSLAIQFAKFAGAKVYTTASEASRDYVEDLGADVVIDYHKENVVEAMKRLEPKGVDVVFDTLGKQNLKESYQLVKKGGHLVSIVEPLDQNLAKQLGIETHYVFVQPNGRQLRKIADSIVQGEIQPIKIKEMPLDKAAEAQEESREGHTKGKIVLKVN
jgi:NADPH2:quinone reductase